MTRVKLVGVIAVLSLVAIGGLLYWFASSDEVYDVRIESYSATADRTVLVLSFTLGVDDTVVETKVMENSDRVTVVVRAKQPSSKKTRDSLGIQASATVTLSAPVGQRHVIDASTGNVVPRLGS